VEPEADFEVVIDQPSPGELNTMQVNGFGFGGQNASMVVTKA
ncbi:MAG: beta-ketoacyl-ACP synthase, partial [Actinomycetia bacterium]|nr:beta-ketoacyl-ACP synthase [Actinomycetes bacterium]